MDEKDYFFGEWVHIYSDEDLKDAIDYLKLWKMFFLRKIPLHTIVYEKIVEREKTEFTHRTLGIKLQVKGPFLEGDRSYEN